MDLLLGIDEGTTAVKVALFDRDLRRLREARRPVATSHPEPGRSEQDPEEVLAAVVAAVAEVLDDAPGRVVACGLDHQGESVLAWDAQTGRPLSPIVTWQDKRQAALLAGLDAESATAITARSGLPLDPYFSAGKLAWLLAHDNAVAAAAAAGTLALGTVDAFLCACLGAGTGTDPSTASRTQLAVPGDVGWDPELCERWGVPLAALPPVADTAGPLGELRHPSWPQALPLTARICDQQAALAGTGCVLPGRVKATYGTGVFVLAHAGHERPAVPDGLLPTVAWRIGGRTAHALDGGVFTAGTLLEWLSRTLGLAADPEALVAMADTVGDAGGVRVLPALAGLGAPWWRADARGVIDGLTAGTRPEHIARAAVEAIAWRVADITAALPRAAELRIDGGLSRSALVARLQADASQLAVRRADPDATVLGAAALAAVGAGLLAGVEDLADRLPAGDPLSPAPIGDGHARWRTWATRAAALQDDAAERR